MKISDILKNLRYEAELTQSALANILQIGQSTIVCYERGEREPTVSNLLKYADYFNVSMDYLTCREDDFGQLTTRAPGDFYTSPTEQKLILNFRRIPPDSQNYVLGIVQNLAANS